MSDIFSQLNKNVGCKPCPICGIHANKIKGCNYVPCNNPICKAMNIHFCYKCGKQLSEAEHSTHYKGPNACK